MPEPNRWLFKEEPAHYSFEELLRDGRTRWDGVENNLALKHLRSVKRGDLAFFYHAGNEKAVVGVMKVTADPYHDPARNGPRFAAVDVTPVSRLPRPVTLAQIKKNPEFVDFDLVRMPRLSVMPVKVQIWNAIMRLGGA